MDGELRSDLHPPVNGSSSSHSESISDAPTPTEDGSDDGFQVISVTDGAAAGLAAASRAAPASEGVDRDGRSGGAVTPTEDNAGKGHDSADGHGATVTSGSGTAATAGIHNERLAAWIRSAIQVQKDSGVSFTQTIRKNKNFRNPAIFEKMISFCDIDDRSSHLPQTSPLQPNDYYEAIAELQEYCMKESI